MNVLAEKKTRKRRRRSTQIAEEYKSPLLNSRAKAAHDIISVDIAWLNDLKKRVAECKEEKEFDKLEMKILSATRKIQEALSLKAS